MLDIHLIRNDREAVLDGLAKRMDRSKAETTLTEIVLLDNQRRQLIKEIDAERQRRNDEAQRIAAEKRSGRGVSVRPATGSSRKGLSEAEAKRRKVEEDLDDILSLLPNLPAEDVVAGGKESNRVVKVWGSPPDLKSPDDHVSVATGLGLIDFPRGVKLSGSGFWIYTGMGARLEWALINWFIQRHLEAGYEFMLPPHLLLYSAGHSAGQFPKFHEDVYHLEQGESGQAQFLLPTSETAILGAFQRETLEVSELPLKVFAYTPCYRRERAGSHSDERGTVRGHQFNKVEIFQFVTEDDAARTLEEMVDHAEQLVQALGLHYRRTLLSAGDASASMRKTLDIEVWMPSAGKYKEVSSVSWAGDYQARRARIRYRERGAKSRFVHTLNGSALATSRIFPAILEQFQQPDGSVLVPDVLREAVGVDRLQPSGKTSQ